MDKVNLMLDTCAINHVLDFEVDPKIFSRKRFYLWVTHIQEKEIKKTQNEDRRKALLSTFKRLELNDISIESGIWGATNWGRSKFSSDRGELYKKIKEDLDNKKKKRNNNMDALIGETALKKKFILVTDDKDFLEVYLENNVEAIFLNTLISRIHKGFYE
ncbi:MAG: hypothetical protein G3M70_09195 [Candidatus Nitronauta litoralis]|uniref:PIN domain-containing protein n=1 Tax=Candidatus Nitronauta litoralis TaxID=2705533 RepID=A0A7T0BW40_9BACT|nr:MAG: hypothetical protein G3M70_09195 [Candidatus Nitronauta litoralis]